MKCPAKELAHSRCPIKVQCSSFPHAWVGITGAHLFGPLLAPVTSGGWVPDPLYQEVTWPLDHPCCWQTPFFNQTWCLDFIFIRMQHILMAENAKQTGKKKKKKTHYWFSSPKTSWGTSLVIQWLSLHTLSAGDLGLILGQGTRSHMLHLRVFMLQLKVPHAATKIKGAVCRNEDLVQPR